MQQFLDGTFGPIEPASELISRLAERAPDVLNTLKAVHFGSPEELGKIRNPTTAALIVDATPADYDSMRRQVDDLTARVNEMAMQHHTQGVRVYPESALHRLPTK